MVLPSIFVHQPAMYWKMSAASGTSATRATAIGLPLSSDSSSASSSVYFEMRSPIRHRILLRSEGVIAGQGPDSNARRAARTAASISALSASAARAMVAPFAGFLTSKVLSEAAASHLPSISSFLGVPMNCATGRDIWGSFITALIVDSPCNELGSHQSAPCRSPRASAPSPRPGTADIVDVTLRESVSKRPLGWVGRDRASRLWFSGERGESALDV